MSLTPTEAPLLLETWPTFAAELQAALDAYGEPALTEQVERLRIIEACSCGDDFCQSFYTAPKPVGAFDAGHRTVPLSSPWQGYLILDVVNDDIVYIEVLYRSPLD